MLEKIKNYLKENKNKILFFLIGILLISLSFALGYISGRDLTSPDIIIQKNSLDQ